jgi:hypothetical protein
MSTATDLAPILRRVIERMHTTGESYEMAMRWFLTEARDQGYMIEPLRPFAGERVP